VSFVSFGCLQTSSGPATRAGKVKVKPEEGFRSDHGPHCAQPVGEIQASGGGFLPRLRIRATTAASPAKL
jgi:hypothetical protein